MNLPNVIAALIKAQDNYDSVAYADCFSETAVVFDEGKIYRGKAEIERWIADANEKYKTVMKPVRYAAMEATGVLTAEISGSFAGSPVVLDYHFEIVEGLIQSLKVSG